MNLFRLFQPAASAPVARERLQILLGYDRKLGSHIELFAGLREEILAVVSRHVVDPEKVQVTVDRRTKFATLAVNIKIPNILSKPVKRGGDERMVDGKNFRLADEVRYILGRAAEHDLRIVTIGQIILLSTETGMRGCLTLPINSPHGWPTMGTPNHSTSKNTRRPSRSTGRGGIASREPHSFTRITKPDSWLPSGAIQRTN
jgi:cell division topological specificity factor